MPSLLLDVLGTASSVGFICALAAVGIAVLPWRRSEVRRARRAVGCAVRLPARLLLAPSGTPAPARARSL